MALTVSKLGEEVGVSADTIRYYERARLLPAPERTEAGYRLYGEEAAERLRFIKDAQRLGLRLREIRELLEVLDRGVCPCGHADKLLHERIEEIDADLRRLRALKRTLVAAVGHSQAVMCDEAGWECAEQLFPRRGGEDGNV